MSHIDDMQALVIVDHAAGFYNLYLSDESGLYFSLSLTDIVIETLYNRWQIDLELVRYAPYLHIFRKEALHLDVTVN